MGRFENAFNLKSIGELQYVRHFVQLLTFIFLNGKALPFLSLSATGLIVPYLHVTQSPFSTVSGAFESLEYTIARGLFPVVVLGVIYITAITVGRVYCGWACPFGLFQDFLSYLPFRKRRLTKEEAKQYKDIKWVVLAFSLICVFVVAWRRVSSTHSEDPIGVFSDSPFSVVSPSGTLFAYIPWMILWNTNVLATAGFVAWLKMALLIAVIVPSIYIPRFFCRYVCPMGALLEPLSQYKALRIHVNRSLPREELNRILNDVCPMGIQIGKTDTAEYIDSGSCIHCGKCVTAAPKSISQRLLENES
eukprot:TRINITY_DN156_c0_g1_i1.p1 TRINITY_DN156_c0_g1~~TRINITY_DN156_c0_g1_i1.p1  ORF type:complete len:305 (-),score=47.76 TRINITY_DN156_c0_g1_i1:47-961(-)